MTTENVSTGKTPAEASEKGVGCRDLFSLLKNHRDQMRWEKRERLADALDAAVALQEAASDVHEVNDNLALLLRRAARKIDPRDPLRTECVAYLKRIGQAGNPLRGVTAAQDAEPLPASDIADMRDAGVLASTAIAALEDIERDASGALNNAFPEEAPDIIQNLHTRASKALKILSGLNK